MLGGVCIHFKILKMKKMYRYLSGFVKNHCKSSIFSIYETIQRVNYDIYPWPNEKNCNGNGIYLACDVKWKRNNIAPRSNLWVSCFAEEKKLKTISFFVLTLEECVRMQFPNMMKFSSIITRKTKSKPTSLI